MAHGFSPDLGTVADRCGCAVRTKTSSASPIVSDTGCGNVMVCNSSGLDGQGPRSSFACLALPEHYHYREDALTRAIRGAFASGLLGTSTSARSEATCACFAFVLETKSMYCVRDTAKWSSGCKSGLFPALYSISDTLRCLSRARERS
jgi:hypothetical protein